MPKFLAIHPLPEPMSKEEAEPFGKAMKSLLTKDAYWVTTWAQVNDEGKAVKLFCEWDGKDQKSVEDLIEEAEMPTEGVYPMEKFDAEDFR